MNFSSSFVSADGTQVYSYVNNSTVLMGCSINNTGVNIGNYFCLSVYSSGAREIFAFDILNSQVVNGTYEFCLAAQSTSACTADFYVTPDSSVTGSLDTTGLSVAALGFSEQQAVSKEQLKYQAVVSQPATRTKRLANDVDLSGLVNALDAAQMR